LSFYNFFASHNDDTENDKPTSPGIWNDFVSTCATEASYAIIRDLGDGSFSILIDQSRDVSVKEQMAVALRHVKIEGRVFESFIGIVHAKDTSALLLKKGIEALFSMHGLSIKAAKPRIQGSQQYTRKLTLWWIA